MRRGLLILLLFPILSYTQPTFHGAIGVPADPGTSATSPVTFNSGAAPLSTMATGDLAIVYLYCRNASATFGINNAGGQSWTSETAHNGSAATLSGQVLWCRFNGSWSASPSFTYSNTTNTNAVMIIFRPVTSTNSWGLSAASNTTQENTLTSRAAAATFGAPADAGSYTPAQNNNVSLLIVSTDDDNTWGTPSNGFTQITSPSSQFRNTSGSDASSAYSYLIQGTAASQTATGLTQATLGNDPGIAGIYIWYEFTPVSLPRRVSIISKK
jgi:hypothetical protein